MFAPKTPIATAVFSPGYIKKSDVVHFRDFHCVYGHKNITGCFETASQLGDKLVGTMKFC